LAYVYIPFLYKYKSGHDDVYPEIVIIDGASWMFINATIVKSGYATLMTFPPNVKYAELFKELSQEAREIKRSKLYQDNIQNGEFKSYYADGSLKEETTYKDGHFIGVRRLYYKSGNLETIGSFTDEGESKGIAKTFFEDGTISAESGLDNGKLNWMKVYDEKGNLIHDTVYEGKGE